MSRDFTISPGAKIGYISLNVSDIQKSLEFYQSTLGFSKIQQQPVGRVLLSGNGISSSSSHLLELVQVSQSEQTSQIGEMQGYIILQYCFQKGQT